MKIVQSEHTLACVRPSDKKDDLLMCVDCGTFAFAFAFAKVAIVSKKRVANENNSATICSRAQNRVQVDAPSKRASPKT